MHRLVIYFFLPMINALLTVKIHQQSFYHPNSSCAFIRNASLSNDASIQSCIWECDYDDDCQTAVYFYDTKICSIFAELCTTGRIESSVNDRASVICYRRNLQPVITCSSTSTVSQSPEKETSISHVITSTNTTTTTISNITTLNVNLVINGDAETGPCQNGTDVTHPTEWNYNGTITQVTYNATFSGSLTSSDPGPIDRGNCYFFGHNSSFTSMWQIINLSNPFDFLLIDNQTVKFNLSAWIGGYESQDDNAVVSLTFIDQSNQALGNCTTIGPVLSNARGNQSKLLFQNANGLVPIGTRFLAVSVGITRSSGSWNNGYVDNIAIILHQ